jgi:hypothetical protein
MSEPTPLKSWLLSMAERLGITFKAAEMRYYRAKHHGGAVAKACGN